MNKHKGCIIAVVFICGLCGGGSILWIRDSQTGHYRSSFGDELTFDVSPDGKEIVYCHPGIGGMDVSIFNIKDQTSTVLLNSDKYESSPHFSSDGTKVVFSGGNPGDRADHLFMCDRLRGSVEQLTFGDFNDTSPSFYEHDSKILFTREDQYRWGGLAPSWNEGGVIDSLNLSNKKVRTIYGIGSVSYWPKMSKNGGLLYEDMYGKNMTLVSGGKKIITIAGRENDLSTDGKSIIYVSGEGISEFSVESRKSWTVLAADRSQEFRAPKFSADSAWIYFFRDLSSTRTWSVWRILRKRPHTEEQIVSEIAFHEKKL